MSKALKCNRCQSCFDPYKVPEDGDIVTIKELLYQNGRQFAQNEYAFLDEDINFCPSCAKIFTWFMNGIELVDKKLLDDLQEDYDELLKEKKNEKDEDLCCSNSCDKFTSNVLDNPLGGS